MGVVNVTPDSFSDGGKYFDAPAAVAHAEELIRDGADLLDVGGESSRPGADPVPLDEELRRVIPVIQELARRHPSVPLSIDTTKAEVARRAMRAGASLLNDISALRFDPGMAAVARETDVPVVLMHMQGNPRTMQTAPSYIDVVREIGSFFRERLAFAEKTGIAADRLLLDPGIGFGKTLDHNLQILKNLRALAEIGRPLVLGLSRKTFIARLLADGEKILSPQERSEGSLAGHLWAAAQGAHILRVHDVRGTRRALRVWQAIARGLAG